LVLGRDEPENEKLVNLCQEGDAMLSMESRPGPTAILRRASSLSADKLTEDLKVAASLVVRYGKKIPDGHRSAEVGIMFNGEKKVLLAEPGESDFGAL
jgi:hypothetical protein